MTVLSSGLYLMMSSAKKSLMHGTRSLEIIQACSLIMATLRKELRTAPETPMVVGGKLMINLTKDRQTLYYFDPKSRQLFTGERDKPSEEEPASSELKPYKFDNGQILDFRFDSSDRGEEAWIINEMGINNKYWFKVEMEVVFNKEWKHLSEEQKLKVLEDPKNRRRFSVTITPRHKNWILQNTQ